MFLILTLNWILQANSGGNGGGVSHHGEMSSPLAQMPLPPKPGQRRFSPLTLETHSSRSESPMSSAASQCDSGRHGGHSQSPISFISSSAPSEATQDSGLGGMGAKANGGGGGGGIIGGVIGVEEGKDELPPPPPPPYKLTHQSPIPERKHISREREEERRESSVRNYSPQVIWFCSHGKMNHLISILILVLIL